MASLYYLKWPLVIIVLGFILKVIGALIKIRHWPYADEILTVSTGIIVAGLIYLSIKLIIQKRQTDV